MDRPENQKKFLEIESRLQEKGLLQRNTSSAGSSKLGSDGRSLGRSSDSGAGSDKGSQLNPSEKIATMYDNYAQHLICLELIYIGSQVRQPGSRAEREAGRSPTSAAAATGLRHNAPQPRQRGRQRGEEEPEPAGRRQHRCRRQGPRQQRQE